MAGEIKRLIDKIVEARAGANQTLARTTKTKLLLKGIDTDKYDSSSPDDTMIVEKIKKLAEEMGVAL